MTDQNNTEHSPSADEEALNGLPQGEREETKEILDEIEGEASKAPEKPEDSKPEDQKPGKEGEEEEGKDPKPEDKPKEGEEGDEAKKPAERREMKTIPAWKKAVADKKNGKLIADLEKQLAEAKGQNPEGDETEEAPKAAPDSSKVKEIAEKHNIPEELAKDLIEAAVSQTGPGITPELQERLDAVDELRNKSELEAEYVQYNADFESSIVPLIKEEYGEDVSPGTISEIREQLKELAYSTEYAKVPYEVIYKGRAEFRGLVPPPKKGAEATKVDTAPEAGGEGKSQDNPDIDLTQPLGDDEIKGLSDKDLDTYLKNMDRRPQS